jgi:hypothetical protein
MIDKLLDGSTLGQLTMNYGTRTVDWYQMYRFLGYLQIRMLGYLVSGVDIERERA